MGGTSIVAQVHALQRMSVDELQRRWLEVFGKPTRQRDRATLRRRLIQKIQDDLLAGLSDEDRATVERYKRQFRSTPPDQWFPGARHNRAKQKKPAGPVRDRRLPPVGAVLSRVYHGQEIQVRVLDKGFEYNGRPYRSLSAVAREVTGTQWNGYAFFGLERGGRR